MSISYSTVGSFLDITNYYHYENDRSEYKERFVSNIESVDYNYHIYGGSYIAIRMIVNSIRAMKFAIDNVFSMPEATPLFLSRLGEKIVLINKDNLELYFFDKPEFITNKEKFDQVVNDYHTDLHLIHKWIKSEYVTKKIKTILVFNSSGLSHHQIIIEFDKKIYDPWLAPCSFEIILFQITYFRRTTVHVDKFMIFSNHV